MKTALDVVETLCGIAGLPIDRLSQVSLPDDKPLLASSFQVGVMAQASVAAAAYGASLLGCQRGQIMPNIEVEMAAAERECTGYFMLDGKVPDSWAPLSGLYPCLDGHVRIHANFDHHRDGACKLLGLTADPATLTKGDVQEALETVNAEEFESRAAAAGMPVSAVRRFTDWDQLPQAKWIAEQPLFRMQKIGEAEPLPLDAELTKDKPLTGIRTLDLTRILAGPVCGRTLATYGADVMLINSPLLPNIAHIADTSRGKRSVFLNLLRTEDNNRLAALVSDAHVFIQGYRPGGIEKLGFAPEALARLRPGIVSVSLSAYGHGGDWSDRRGFDSLVQTATGFNHAEGQAFNRSEPQALPVQILDFASGFLMAFAASAALLKQQQEGGSWHVDVSLAQTAHFLRGFGQISDNTNSRQVELDAFLEQQSSGFGELAFLPHAAKFNGEPCFASLLSNPPGSDAADWWR